ncbi:MAG: DUF3306 domain-containing protein, partial [Rubrivivax sp.]|nr:DUF3306 domain-containing protein [Rubrivivax sp.]
MSEGGSGFLARWSHRKAQARQQQGEAPQDLAPQAATAAASPAASPALSPALTPTLPSTLSPTSSPAMTAAAAAAPAELAAAPAPCADPSPALQPPGSAARALPGPAWAGACLSPTPRAGQADSVAAPAAAQPAPLPTLADVAALTRQSDFSRFVAPGVDGVVKNAALRKLFGDPRFNVM